MRFRDVWRKGLLSGDALYLDLKRMEMAYHDNNKRELMRPEVDATNYVKFNELTKHVSLRQLNPLASWRSKPPALAKSAWPNGCSTSTRQAITCAGLRAPVFRSPR